MKRRTVILACVFLLIAGVVATYVLFHWRMARIISQIHKAGGSVTETQPPPDGPIGVFFGPSYPGDDRSEFDDQAFQEILPHLKKLPILSFLSLSKAKVSDEGLVGISELTRLKKLDLSETAITDASIGEIAMLQNLEHLVIYNTAITEKGLKQLRRLLPQTEIFEDLSVPDELRAPKRPK